MITGLRTSTGTMTAFYCDICAERIADARHAVVLYRRAVSSVAEGFVEVGHVHKGDCLNAAQARWGRRWKIAWDEMLAHVSCLVTSVGLSPAALQEWED